MKSNRSDTRVGTIDRTFDRTVSNTTRLKRRTWSYPVLSLKPCDSRKAAQAEKREEQLWDRRRICLEIEGKKTSRGQTLDKLWKAS